MRARCECEVNLFNSPKSTCRFLQPDIGKNTIFCTNPRERDVFCPSLGAEICTLTSAITHQHPRTSAKKKLFCLSQGAVFCVLTSAKSKIRKLYYIKDRDIPQITLEIVQFRLRRLKILEIGFEGTPKL